MQAECIRRAGGYQKLADSEGKEPVRLFWDGFQWVAKTGHSTALQNDPALMNSTRKMRRLYFGNLPLHLGLTETSFQEIVWEEMKRRGFCNSPEDNPVLCVWFAKDKGNYGFVEFASVDETERALTMDGMMCLGVPLKVSRPNDYSTATTQQSQAMAIMGQQSAQLLQMQQAGVPVTPEMATSMVGVIPPPPIPGASDAMCPLPAPKGPACLSRVIRIIEVIYADTVEEMTDYEDVLDDVKQGCDQHGRILNAIIITPDIRGDLPYKLGDVFLEFENISAADVCLSKMAGRKYEGRPIDLVKVEMSEFERNIRPLLPAQEE